MGRSARIVVDEGLPTGPIVLVLEDGSVVAVRRWHGEDGLARPATASEVASFYAHVLGEAPFCYPFSWRGVPPFARKAIEQLREIPCGETRTYGWLAAQLGVPRAARAVGRAMALNPYPVFYPCHRVVGRKGPGGYSFGGSAVKEMLLGWERAARDRLRSER